MKKMLLTMLMGMMMVGAAAQEGKFTVKGTFEYLGDSVHFYIPSIQRGEFRAVTGEMMEVTFDLKDAGDIIIERWFTGRSPDEEDDFRLPAIPGETLVVTKDENGDIRFGGSQFYVDFYEASNYIKPAIDAFNGFLVSLRERMDAGVPDEQLMEEFNEKMPLMNQGIVDAVMDYIKAHPDQDASAALIAELPDDLKYMEPAIALLTERARNSVAANLYKENLEKAKKEAEEEAKKYAMEGKKAPDFTLNDINGNPLALKSLRGKWVVLDFWGSWCVWCIKGMPKMKEYYNKYAGKFEILGVDCNDTVEKWKAAVAENELPWLHVYCDPMTGDNPVWYYGVQSFPTKIVVNPEGQVAKVVIGEDPSFYNYLDELLK